MSITANDLLKLPSLSQAKVLAGHGGLHKIVDSISVLEYAESTALQDELFNNNDFNGSEIVISGLINIKDDITSQLQTIRRLKEVGEIGLILYYVGIFLPAVDQKLIDLANELDFLLICMPENRMDMRYSEVIYEVVQAIIIDKQTDQHFVTELLERIIQLPDHQRSMDSVLKMLSIRTNSSLFLIDKNFKQLNAAYWPSVNNIAFHDISTFYHHNTSRLPVKPEKINLGRKYTIASRLVKDESALPLALIMVKEEGDLEESTCEQVTEVTQLFINIWSQNHSQVGTEELIRAIINDEPIKMRRIADVLHVDVKAIDQVYILFPMMKHLESAPHDFTESEWQEKLDLMGKQYFQTTLIGQYQQTYTLFLGKAKHKEATWRFDEEILDWANHQSQPMNIVTGYGLKNTSDVRQAYLLSRMTIKEAVKIYRHKHIFTMMELRFAQKCQTIIEEGEAKIKEVFMIFDPLENHRDELTEDLYATLESYYLDANMNVAETGKRLFVHRNTIKYRMTKLKELYQFPMNKMPEAYDLYVAVGVRRLLNSLAD